jgi:hypothetical protein
VGEEVWLLQDLVKMPEIGAKPKDAGKPTKK